MFTYCFVAKENMIMIFVYTFQLLRISEFLSSYQQMYEVFWYISLYGKNFKYSL